MSPFSYADKIKTPILLIHGEADNNTGTFPIQSERFYDALKGEGATVRFVLLPLEAHDTRARKRVAHALGDGKLARQIREARQAVAARDLDMQRRNER